MPPTTNSHQSGHRDGRAPSGLRRFRLLIALLAVVGLGVLVVLVASTPSAGHRSTAAARSGAPGIGPTVITESELNSRCPWLAAAMDRHESPGTLAHLVIDRMTSEEKLGEIVLVQSGGHENIDSGVPRLCIPALDPQDGPQGVGFDASHVTQLPAPLGIAASFDPALALAYGEVEGSETRGKGLDVVQGPTLNIDRVPNSGRSYEGYGEDPTLVSAMGVANIEGIQSTGAMAMAKHFAVYNQETNRSELNDVVSQRALEELYLPPFKAAVTKAHVDTVMCAYPLLNGVFQCQSPALLALLRQWGFTGFVRSDLGSVHEPATAIAAGTDLIKPASVRTLAKLVREHQLGMSAVNVAVSDILSTLFADGLVGHGADGSLDSVVDTPAHTQFALTAAEQSAVLLKDAHSILPLAPSSTHSIAVIGAAAETKPVTTGFGSSRVRAPFTSLPLDAIRQRAGTHVPVTYVNGGSTTGTLPAVPSSLLTPSSGTGHGLTLTLTQSGPVLRTVTSVLPTADVRLRPHPSDKLLPFSQSSAPVDSPAGGLSLGDRTSGIGRLFNPTRSEVVLPAGWSDATATLTGTLTPPRTGLYTLSLQGSGAMSLSLDGSTVVADTLSHALGHWSQAVTLTGGHAYQFDLAWTPYAKSSRGGASTALPSTLTLGWQYDSDQIAAAAAAARRNRVAVVFAGSFSSEAYDRPSLTLPGDENQLISAVAAANPRTVVVLNTGGAVLMPWLPQVAGVLEDWFPGEQDGAAVAALLYGDVDPDGRLPVTFPTSQAQSAINTTAQWPGIDLTSDYTEGLEVGYRYNHATGVQPLFPFGFGLSYTRFSLSHLVVSRTAHGYVASIDVTNQGSRSGTDVPQAYLTFPSAAGEPPAQLVAFDSVALTPGQTRVVSLAVPSSALQAYLGTTWQVVPGAYTLSVGTSSSNLPLSATLPGT